MTVTTLGIGNWGYVFAEICMTGEFKWNFIDMQTSSGIALNIIGDRCMAELRGGCGSISN